MVPRRRNFLSIFSYSGLLCRVIRRENIDIIHAHNYEGALIGIMAKWLTRRPLLYNAVNLMGDELAGYSFIRPGMAGSRHRSWLGLVHANLSRIISRLCHLNFGLGSSNRAFPPARWIWFRRESSRICLIIPQPEKFRQRYQLDGRPVVMYTGVLNAYQRIDYLLRAFAVALREKPDALLLIVSPLVSETDEKAISTVRSGTGNLALGHLDIAAHVQRSPELSRPR